MSAPGRGQATQSENISGRRRGRDRAIVKAVVATLVARVSIAGVAFVALGIAARALTSEEFGVVATLLALWLVLTMMDVGVGSALVTRVAGAHARDDPAELRAHVRTALFSLTAIGGFIAVAGAVAAVTLPWGQWIGGQLPPSVVVPCVVVTFGAAGAAMPAAIGVLTLSGTQRMWLAQVWATVGSLLTLVVCVAVVLAGARPWTIVFAIVGTPTLVAGALTIWIICFDMPQAGRVGRVDARQIKSMMRASGYFAVINIGNSLSLGTGVMIVASVLGPAEAAKFSVVTRLFGLITSMVGAAGAQLWPPLTEAISRGDIRWARSRYYRGVVVAVSAATAASLVLVGVGRPLAELWVGSALVPQLDLFAWTAALTVAIAIAGQASVLLVAVERVRALAVLSLTTAAVSVTASVLLTRWLGPEGAMIGPLLACALIALPGTTMLVIGTMRTLELEDDAVTN